MYVSVILSMMLLAVGNGVCDVMFDGVCDVVFDGVWDVMDIFREILEEEDPILSDSSELYTVQFADDCTNVMSCR